jgi:hypothetical protein
MNYVSPIFIQPYNLYDVFHNGDELVIIAPYHPTPHQIYYVGEEILPFQLHTCPHRHTLIYVLPVKYTSTVSLKIDEVFETRVNQYPRFNDILMSTIVKDEDNVILTWIDYHRRLGVSKFIIYDNSEHTTLSTLLDNYIKSNICVLIKWNYPYTDPVSGISGQTTQQNHSIYAFKHATYIGLFDVDEYVNLQGISNVNLFFKHVIVKEKLDVNRLGSFRLLNKFFYNPYEKPVHNGQFLTIYNCDTITPSGREKNFVLPKNVITFAVHMITHGKSMYTIPEKYAYFNHYYYLNKPSRGRNKTKFLDKSILQHLNHVKSLVMQFI